MKRLLLITVLLLTSCTSQTRTAPPASFNTATTEPAKPKATGLLAETVNATKNAGDATWSAVTSPAKLFRKKTAAPQPAPTTQPDGPSDLILLSPQDSSGDRPVLVAPAGN